MDSKKKLILIKKQPVANTKDMDTTVHDKLVIPGAATAKAAQHICIKVDNLRKLGYAHLKDWLQDPNNIYVGRRGRVAITDPKSKAYIETFHYKDSKWANPFVVGKPYKLEEALEKYMEHLKSGNLLNEIRELKGKNLGCFCGQGSECHAKVLANLANSAT
jgi:hypothetical protein